MITTSMARELSRISRGEKEMTRTVRNVLARRGFAKRVNGQFVLTEDGETLLNFWSRK